MINIIKPTGQEKELALFRGNDSFGSGSYKAPRGTRNGKPRYHNGMDYLAPVGSAVFCIKAGMVTKIGLPYSEGSLRYVQVTDDNGYKLRYFYVQPTVKVGDKLEADSFIGIAQNLDLKYEGMSKYNHIHFEIMDFTSRYVNPAFYIKDK